MAAAKKDTELKVPTELKGVDAKLQAVRVALQKLGLKKSGKNTFANFDFFQLSDFLPQAQKLFADIGLISNYTIMPRVIDVVKKDNGVIEPIIKTIARLVIKDIETKDEQVFEMEVEPVVIGNNTKQNIYQAAGGRSTYYKRYLYRDALEIEESDECDAVLGAPNVEYQAPQVQVAPVQAQPVPQATTVQQVEIGQPITIESQPVQTAPTGNPEDLISQQSKEEVMSIILGKGLNGFEVISNYCSQNGIPSPSALKEKDKNGLIEYVGTL